MTLEFAHEACIAKLTLAVATICRKSGHVTLVSQAGLVYLVGDRLQGDISRRVDFVRPGLAGGAVLSVMLTAGEGRDGVGGLINIRFICAHFWKSYLCKKLF